MAELEDDLRSCLMVFEGSSQEDVAYAKVLWSSVCLQPPVESNLRSVDVTQRLRIRSKPTRTTVDGLMTSQCSTNEEFLQRVCEQQKQEEKQRYLQMAKKQDEIKSLLKKQREERIKKETVSRPHKPRTSNRTLRSPCTKDLNQDVTDVRELV